MGWLSRRIFLAYATAGTLFPAALAVAQPGESCRQVTIENDGKRETRSICRAPGGASRTQAEPASRALPPDFRGRIVYCGNYSGSLMVSGRPPRRLNLREILNSAPTREDIAGDMEISLEFDGDNVRGTYRPTGRLGRSQVSGTRQGNECRLYDPDGWPWTGRCDREGFQGSAQSIAGQEPVVRFGFQTRTLSFVDRVVEERERAIASAERERQQADAMRRASASVEVAPSTDARRTSASQTTSRRGTTQGGSRPSSTQAARYRSLLDRTVADDSLGWNFFSYARGSMRISAIDTRPTALQNGATAIVTGEFSYGGGTEGWVRAQVSGNMVLCVEYRDTFGICRPVNTPESIAEGRAQTEPSGRWGRCDPLGIGSDALRLDRC